MQASPNYIWPMMRVRLLAIRKAMQHRISNRLIQALMLCAMTPAIVGQDKPATAFPGESWKAIALKPKQRAKLNYQLTTKLSEKGVAKLRLTRPKDFDATVITDLDGKVLGQSLGKAIELPARKIGDRFVVYVCRTKAQSYLKLLEDFVQYPQREFPGKAWKPRKDANLVITKPQQFTPKTMFEAYDKPHKFTFTPKTDSSADVSKATKIYLMTKIDAGGKEQVATQSLTGELKFWMRAKRGESFRIYELFPHNKSYRVSKTLTVAADYPLGR